MKSRRVVPWDIEVGDVIAMYDTVTGSYSIEKILSIVDGHIAGITIFDEARKYNILGDTGSIGITVGRSTFYDIELLPVNHTCNRKILALLGEPCMCI